MFFEDLAIYNTEHRDVLLQFNEIKNSVKCPFAKTANIVDHMVWDQTLTFNENLQKLLYQFENFTNNCEKNKLDGFVVTAPSYFGRSPEVLGEFLRRILFYLSEHDPSGKSCLKENITDIKWKYRFSHMFFFVSTFASCYPEKSTRSAYDAEQTFLLFQPKISFTRSMSHNSAMKNMQHMHIRDKFSKMGTPYSFRDLECQKFVFPYEDGGKAVEWWKPNNNFDLDAQFDPRETSTSMQCNLM